ncbi:MAG TPA: hypothetical protein PK215_09945, partial [Clostridiales bacterium]|nr:hypothetical protein [Clostridiales bacterium]
IRTTDPEYVKNKLTTAYENGEYIDIVIKDSSTGKRVPVTAKIAELVFDNKGGIKAVLDEVHVPLDSITNIRKPSGTNTDGSGKGPDTVGETDGMNESDVTPPDGQEGDKDGN